MVSTKAPTFLFLFFLILLKKKNRHRNIATAKIPGLGFEAKWRSSGQWGREVKIKEKKGRTLKRSDEIEEETILLTPCRREAERSKKRQICREASSIWTETHRPGPPLDPRPPFQVRPGKIGSKKGIRPRARGDVGEMGSQLHSFIFLNLKSKGTKGYKQNKLKRFHLRSFQLNGSLARSLRPCSIYLSVTLGLFYFFFKGY